MIGCSTEKAGIKPKKHIFDNEASEEYKEVIIEEVGGYELVPKGQHRRNIAKKAIQTWKSHAIGVFSGLPASFTIQIWDLLLPQIDMQLNMLRFSHVTPNVCAWTVLHGQHDFNCHPLAPLGIEFHMLEHPNKQKTWEVHSKKGYYIGTSL